MRTVSLIIALLTLPCASPSHAADADDRISAADQKLAAPFGSPSSVLTSEWSEIKLPRSGGRPPLILAGVPTVYFFQNCSLTILRQRSGALVLVGVKATERLNSELINQLKVASGRDSSEGDFTSIVSNDGRQFFAFSRALLTKPTEERSPNKSPEATPGQRPPASPSPSSGAPQR